MRRLVPFLALLLLTGACGDSPVGPTDPEGLRLTNMRMTWFQQQGSGGLVTIYSLCGNVGLSPGASEDLVVRAWEVTINNPDGSILFTWTDPLFAGDRIGLGIAGCFGGPIDPVPGRGAGATYRLRVTYYGGGKGVVETSGPIQNR